MGTHISRVKSVDLDAWTDEQMQSVLRWGNNRANKSVESVQTGIIRPNRGRYWEAKLAPGHVPSDAYGYRFYFEGHKAQSVLGKSRIS